MSRRKIFRTLALGLIPAAVLAAGSAPAMAQNATAQAFPDTAVTDSQDVMIESSGKLIFNTTMTNDETGTPNLKLLSATKRLIINTAEGVTFEKGVNVESDIGQIEFVGPVTFDVTPDENNTGDVRNKLSLNHLYFTGLDEGAAAVIVKGDQLDVGTSKVSLNKNIEFKFQGSGGGGEAPGLSDIDTLNLADSAATNLSFGDKTILTADNVIAGVHGSIIKGAVSVGGGARPETMTHGLEAKTLVIDGGLTIDGQLTGGGGEAFVYNTAASIVLTENSLGSDLEGETQFKLSDKFLKGVTAVTVFKPIDVAGDSAEMMKTFRLLAHSLSLAELSETDITNLEGGEAFYDPNSGYVVVANYQGRGAMSGIPAYGLPYVTALGESHQALAVALKGAAKTADVTDDLNSMMGNVQNAALAAAMGGGMDQVMGHLNSTLSSTMPGFAGPGGDANGLWAAPVYSKTSIKGERKKGYTDVDINSPGLTLGYDRRINDRLLVGVFAAFSKPESESDHDKVESENLQGGLYAQAQLNYGLNVNMAVGYGRQSHEAKRNIRTNIIEGYNQMVKGSFDSTTVSASLEASRLIPLDRSLYVRPTVGYTYVATEMDGYREKSNVANPANDLSQKVDDAELTLHLIRLGAEAGWSDRLTTVTGRLFWVGNMGDSRAKTRATLVTSGAVPFSVTGAEYDKNMFNVGLGIQYVPPQFKGVSVGMNYDALLGSQVKSHNLSLMMRYEF